MSRGLGGLQIPVIELVESWHGDEHFGVGDVCIECPTISEICETLAGEREITAHTYRQIATAVRSLHMCYCEGECGHRCILVTEHEEELASEGEVDDYQPERLHVGVSGYWSEVHPDWHRLHPPEPQR